MVKAPGCKQGIKNNRIVNSVDIYPTLMELCGVSQPEGLEGQSFANLLNKPNDKKWKDAAFSYFRNGVTLRTPEYRFTRYDKKGEVITELYQYGEDRTERKNIANEKPEIVRQLLPIWEKGITFSY